MQNMYGCKNRVLCFYKLLLSVLFLVFLSAAAGAQTYDPTIGITNNTGFNTDMNFVQRTINYDKEIGIYAVRMGMDGVGGYNEGDSFNWTARDAVVNKYVSEGFKIYCVIAPRAHTNRNVSYDQWKRNYDYFCKAVMNRYKGKITYYIVDNEPDLNYGAPIGAAITPAQAVDFTVIAYNAALGIDANIRIESPPPVSCETTYLRDMISLGVTRYCHYLGVHAYGSQIDDGRLGKPWEYMAQYSSFPQRPVVCSECGTNPDWKPAGMDGNTWQARWFEQFNVQLKRYGYNIALLYRLDESGHVWDVYQKPAYNAIKNAYLNKSLTNGDFETSTSLVNPNEWMKTYSADAASAPSGIYRTTSDKRSGTSSLKIDGNGNVRQIIGRLTPGTSVTVTAWVKAINGGAARLTLQGYNITDGDAEIVRSSTSSAWTQLSATVTPSQGFLVVELEGAGGNTFYDDVAVSGSSGDGGTATYYRIKNRWQNNYLYDGGDNVRYGTGSDETYQWVFEDYDGHKRIRNRSTGHYMHLENLTGSVQCISPSAGWHSNHWLFEDYDGHKRIRNRWQSASYIHIENLNGNAQYGSISAGAYSSQWTFEAVTGSSSDIANGTYTLTPECAQTTRLDVAGASTTSGTNIQISTDNGHSAQQWIVEKQSDGTYRLSSKLNKAKVLDVAGAGSANGTNVHLWDWLGNTAQKWTLTSVGNGYYKLTPLCTPGKCLDVDGGSSTAGTNVQLWDDNGATAQRWKFTLISTSTARESFEQKRAEDQVLLSPNPATDRVTLKLGAAGAATVKVTDLQGRVLLTRKLSGSPEPVLNVAHLAGGLYVVQMTVEGKTVTQKLLIQR